MNSTHEQKFVDGFVKGIRSLSKGNLMLLKVYRILGNSVADWEISHYKVVMPKKNEMHDNLSRDQAELIFEKLCRKHFQGIFK